MKNKQSNDISPQIWAFFASVKLTVMVLLLLAALSIVGTIIPQNANPELYFQKYGESLYNIFSVFQFFDIFHSIWFRLLIVTLTINIIVCSFDRLSSVWKIIFPDKPKFSIASFKKASGKNEFTVSQPVNDLKDNYKSFLSKRFGFTSVEQTDSGLFIFAEKGRWTRLGVYAVHLSVVLLLLGSLVGSIGGFDGFVTIPEGESIDHIQLTNAKETIPLNFEIKCDDFSVSFYDSGAPKEYRSGLSIIENNQTVVQKDIIVNDPLRYKGINIFQSSYGSLEPKSIALDFFQKSTKTIFSHNARINEPVVLPNNMGRFTIVEFKTDLHVGGQHMGMAFIGTLQLKTNDPIEVIIPYPFPKVDFTKPEELTQLSMLQSSKSIDLPKEITVTFTSKKTGMTYTQKGAVGVDMNIPEDLGKFQIKELKNSYSFMGRDLGEAFIGILTTKSGKPENIFLPVKFANFDKMRQGDVVISVSENNFQKKSVSSDLIVYATSYEDRYYTGLQVTKDPGVGLVYAGFIIMIIGCYITFFMSHRKLCIEMKPIETRTHVRVAGTANKNKLGMQNYVNKITNRLKKLN